MQGESIIIGDDIKITVVAVRNGHGGFKVRLGIDADKSIPVHRLEVYEAIKAEQRKEGAK
jgi:carbon storage regulator